MYLIHKLKFIGIVRLSSFFLKTQTCDFLGNPWLRLWASNAGGKGSAPVWGTRVLHAKRCGQKKQKKPHKPDEILFKDKVSEQLVRIIVRNVMLQITNSKPDTWEECLRIRGLQQSETLLSLPSLWLRSHIFESALSHKFENYRLSTSSSS